MEKLTKVILILILIALPVGYAGDFAYNRLHSNQVEIVSPTDGDSVIIIGKEHHEIHEGNHYFITGFQTVDDGDSITFGITTAPDGTKAHVNTFIEGTSQIEIYVYEASVFTGGVPVTALNNNRNSSKTSMMTLVASPTVSDLGNLLRATSSGKAGINPAAANQQGIQARDRELILNANTTYIFQTISKDDGNIISFEASWYEDVV